MKKFSTFQLILLAAFGAFAVSGMLIFALAVGGQKSSAIGPVTIWGTFDAAAMTQVLQQAADATQQLSQVRYVEKDPASYERDLTDALASGKGPDLFILRSDYALKDASKVMPIPYASVSKTQFADTFVDAAAPYLSDDGALGVPMVVDPLVLYWNRDLLGTAGYAQPPKYWDEVSGMAAKLTKRSEGGGISRAGVALGGFSNISGAKAILTTLIMQAGGSITTRGQAGGLESALQRGSQGAALSALGFYTEFADPSRSDYSWNGSLRDARSAFASGDVALYVGYGSEESLIRQMNPNLQFSVAPLPQVRGAASGEDGGWTYAFAVPRGSANAQGALSTAFLLGDATTSAAFSKALGLASARRDVLSQPQPAGSDLLNRMAIITKSWLDPDPVQTNDLFRAMIEDTVSGALTAPDAVARADQQMAHIIGP